MCLAGESGIILMVRAAFHQVAGVSGATAMPLRISQKRPRRDVNHRGERTLRESVTMSFSLISLFLSSLSSHTQSEITDVQSTDVNIALNPRCPVCASPAASPEKHTKRRTKQTGQGDGRRVCAVFSTRIFLRRQSHRECQTEESFSVSLV